MDLAAGARERWSRQQQVPGGGGDDEEMRRARLSLRRAASVCARVGGRAEAGEAIWLDMRALRQSHGGGLWDCGRGE